MKTNSVRLAFGVVTCVAAILVFAVSVQASVRVGGWALSGNGQLLRNWEYTGSCPVDLKFDWGVISTEPANVSYTIARSDGALSPGGSVYLPNGNQSVPIIREWHLGANNAAFADFHGWTELNIESPNRESRRINFTLHCGSDIALRVGGASLRANGQLAQGFEYTGACPVHLQFGWGLLSSEPTSIQYTFLRNDGGHTTVARTANLRGEQSTPIYEDWQLGANTPQFANYAGWVELRVEAPSSLSNSINFRLHCQ